MRNALHIVLVLSSLLLIGSPVFAQKKNKEDKVSYKERKKFDRLFIDAGKAKMLADYEQAVKLFESCVKIDPDQPAPHYELGNLYMHFGEAELALESAEKAAELDPTNYYYRLLHAEILKNNQQFEEAVKAYKSVANDFPNKVSIYIDLALLYVLQKDYANAIEVYDQLEEQIGPNEEVKLKKQYLYLQTGEVEKAAEEIEELIELDPENVQYYLLLAEIYYINDLTDKAGKTYKKAGEKFPDNAQVHLSISDFYRSREMYEKALGHLKIAFASPDLDVDSKVKGILSYFDLASRNPAYRKDLTELGEILLKAHPDDARALTINGDINLNNGNMRKARLYFMKAVEVDNSRYPIWSQLLILEADLQIFDTLAIHGQQAIDLFPNQPVCYYFLGYAKSQLDEHKEAADTYKRGVGLVFDNDPLKIQFYLGMADSYNEAGEFKSSDEAFDAILAMDSNNTIALNNYSYYLSLRNERLETALKMSEKSNKIEPDNATYLDTYAWIFYQLARYEEAKTHMEKALKFGGGNSGVILEHMGDIYFKLNEVNQALKYWKKASEKEDHSDLLDKKINDKKLYE